MGGHHGRMGLCLDRGPLHRIGGLSHRGDTLAQAILTVAPSRPWGLMGTGSALVLRTPRKNIERCRDLLKTKLTEVELHLPLLARANPQA